jgi:hypothetical protein
MKLNRTNRFDQGQRADEVRVRMALLGRRPTHPSAVEVGQTYGEVLRFSLFSLSSGLLVGQLLDGFAQLRVRW